MELTAVIGAREWRVATRSRVSHRVDRARLRWSRANPALQQFLAARPTEALPPDYTDLWFLYRTVRKLKPTALLEFGSGCSTAVLAAAIHRNRAGHLWTVEAVERWADATEAALPDQLRPLVTVVYSPAREDNRDVPGWSHTVLPDVEPDFLYLDGPPLRPGSKRHVAFDPLDLEPRFKRGFVMVIDGRWKNAKYFRSHLRRSYRFERLPNYRFLFRLLD